METLYGTRLGKAHLPWRTRLACETENTRRKRHASRVPHVSLRNADSITRQVMLRESRGKSLLSRSERRHYFGRGT